MSNLPTPKSLQVYDIFVDESSQTANRFLVLGGVTIPQRLSDQFGIDLYNARLPELPFSELKWGKVSRSKLPAYERFTAAFFANPAAQFHALVVDTTQQRHAVYNMNSREVGFNKEIYQLLLKMRRLYGGYIYHGYLDKRDTPQPISELRTIVNRGIHKNYGMIPEWPFRRLQFRDSAALQQIQLADIFCGAIAYQLNGHLTGSNPSQFKRQFSEQILRRARVTNVFANTSMSGKFTIWHRKLSVPQP